MIVNTQLTKKFATGPAILCEARDITEEEAYRRLRDKAQNSNTTIASVAAAVVASEGV